MTKLIVSFILLAGMFSARAQSQPAGAWGGTTTEKYWSATGAYLGYHYRYNGALADPTAVDTDVSYSPWTGNGPPLPTYIKERGTTRKWKAGTVTGSAWTVTADNQRHITTLTPVSYSPDEFPSPTFFWGTYTNQDAAGKYQITGTLRFEVKNTTTKTWDFKVISTWAATPAQGAGPARPQHTTTQTFYVKPGEMNGCLPIASGFPHYGWMIDFNVTGTVRP